MTKTLLFSSVLRGSSLALVALLAASCGNSMGSRVNRVSSDSVHYGAEADLAGLSGQGSTIVGNFTCPNSPNIPFGGDTTYDNSGNYTACANSQDSTQVLIHGQTRGASVFCVFPIQVVDATHVYWKPDLSTGLPLYQCANVPASNSSGVTFSFSGISFNALFIVEGNNDQYAMQSCLESANTGGCPLYSYGKFR